MSKISVWNYAISFWKRDIVFSLFTGFFSTGILFFLVHSLRLQFALSGGISLSSIEALKNSPDLLFYLSLFSLSFLVLGTIFPRSGDLGIMMAVGGNTWVCVQIHLIFILLQTFPGFLLAQVLNYAIVPDLGSSHFWVDFLWVEIYGLLAYTCIVLVFGVPSVLLATTKDAYSAIRRLK